MARERRPLEEIRAENPEKATVADLPFDFEVYDCDNETYLEVERIGDELNAYLAGFARSEKCLGCGANLCGKGLAAALLSTFTWGIANGEGYCATCGYPARAYHRNVGPIEFFDAIFQYHPDVLIERAREEDARNERAAQELDDADRLERELRDGK